jgi:hypothetical protein
LDINLLKPCRIELVDEPAPLLCISDTQACPPKWLEYIYWTVTAHTVLRRLPSKLAEWIGENLQDVLGFPDKADQRAEPGSGWTPAELNHILTTVYQELYVQQYTKNDIVALLLHRILF